MVKPRAARDQGGPPGAIRHPPMPSANRSLHSRALVRALARESLELLWESASGTVAFRATLNPVSASETDPVDRNDGDNTACTLTAVVSATAAKALRPDNLPEQGDNFTDEVDRTYRVGRIGYTKGLPSIVFHIPNVAEPV